MTSRFGFPLACACGHEGQIIMRENDAPFSRKWESYTLIDFNGSDYHIDGTAGWPEVFEHMKPTCPECGKGLTPANVKG